MIQLTLAVADRLIDAAINEAGRCEAQPLAVVVLDAGGHLVAAKRMDGASLFRVRIATAKAAGALGMGMGTREMAARAQESPAFFQALSAVVDGGLALSPGGVLLRSEGVTLGAIGASGDKGPVDEACLLPGIAAAGFDAAA